ncbi:Crp/Fnr family transcriptional regulator [Hazenella coriacea]|uniref:CRP/FNR family transcriptional regulator n=1 Tax=Hazenella coriacea TaxID=1179467 RepID=A0A4V2UUY6_9BACL|nr:Crp/Fnr family transcriptional regulator [Hazenella coriacea]TCS93617.1 CRP/FNR family transcriptional regulator [Hazenella coriacea]
MDSNTPLSFFPAPIVHNWLHHKPRKSLKKGEYIMSPTDEKRVYLLTEGTAQLFHIHPDGKECVIDLLKPGEAIGLLEIFSEREAKRFARALTPVEVIPLLTTEVKQVITDHPSLAFQLLHYVTEQLEETIDILEQVAYGKVEERLLFLLYKLTSTAESKEGYSLLPDYLTHRDLAGMIASTRETVTFIMNKWLHEGVIMEKEHRLWIKKN